MSKLFNTPLNINVATGTAPLAVSSTTLVTNLNADMLNGQHGSYYAPLASPTFSGTVTATTFSGNATSASTAAALTGAQAAAITANTAKVGYTAALARADCVASTITGGVTTSAPAQNAVFDALALKAPVASPIFTGNVTSNGNLIIAADETKGLGFWGAGATGYGVMMQTTATGGRVATETSSDYNLYLNMGGVGRGFVFKTNGTAVGHMAGDGVMHTTKGFRSNHYSIEYNVTEDSLDFCYT